MKKIKLDRINKAILTELQTNARISNIELAERVSLSPSACLQRTKALEDAGLIRDYIAITDLDSICYNVMAYLMIELNLHNPQERVALERSIDRTPELVDCMKVGGHLDYVSLAVCSSVEELNQLCDQLKEENPVIGKLNTYVIMNNTKWLKGYPLERLEWKEEAN